MPFDQISRLASDVISSFKQGEAYDHIKDRQLERGTFRNRRRREPEAPRPKIKRFRGPEVAIPGVITTWRGKSQAQPWTVHIGGYTDESGYIKVVTVLGITAQSTVPSVLPLLSAMAKRFRHFEYKGEVLSAWYSLGDSIEDGRAAVPARSQADAIKQFVESIKRAL